MKVPISEILDYLSADATTCGWLTGETVIEVLVDTPKKGPHGNGDIPYEECLQHIKEHGIRYPVHVGLAEYMGPQYGFDPMGFEGTKVLGNGHHRVGYALLLGYTELEVTDRKEESGFAKTT